MSRFGYLPGLPSISEEEIRKYPFNNSRRTKFIPVLSYNYDYLPMNIESPKCFWVDLNGPPPEDFEVRKPVRLFLTPESGIDTMPFGKSSGLWNSVFFVDDIVGSRIILSPYRESEWMPTIHQPTYNPFGWGYSTETVNISSGYHGVKYGFGVPLASLEYYPAVY